MIGNITLSGTLIDSTGKAIAGAKVVLKSVKTGDVISGLAGSFTTGVDGSYSVNVPYGSYKVYVEIEGEQTAMPGFFNVYDYSANGSLQDFLYQPCEEDNIPMFLFELETIRQDIKKSYKNAIDSVIENLIPLSKQYMTLAEAEEDIANIPDGSVTYIRSTDGTSLADEYMNVAGTLTATGRKMPSQQALDTGIAEIDAKKVDKYEGDSPDLLIALTDQNGNLTWLQARIEDGLPTQQAEAVISDVVGRDDVSDALIGGEEVLFSIKDDNGNATALSVRKEDGMFVDKVIDNIAERLHIGTSEDVSANFKTYNRPFDFQMISSISRALGRHFSGTPLPTTPYDFVNSYGQGNRIYLPDSYDDSTPIPLVMFFDGVGSTGGAEPPSVRSAYDTLKSAGIAYCKSRAHGTSYGSPDCMLDYLELYQKACEIAPIGAVILYGNSMGGIAAQNALLTNTIPSVSGLYLVDPTYDLYQRYTNGRQNEINAAYGCTPATYAEKTAGYDPALRHWSEYRGLPIHIRASSGDTSVVLSLHGGKLKEYLGNHNDVTIFDTQTAGHNTSDRFDGEDLISFIKNKCISGSVIL